MFARRFILATSFPRYRSLFFVPFLLLFLLVCRLSFVFRVVRDSRGVCARARLASFQCVTRAQCETADVARHGIFF